MITRLDRFWIAAALAGAMAIALPAWLLWPPTVGIPASPPLRITPLRGVPAPAFDQALARPLFAPGRVPPAEMAEVADDAGAPVPEPQSPPQLVGTIAGERGGVALLRLASGETVRVRVGEDADGWRAVAIADRTVVLEQGGRRETVRLEFRNDKSGDDPAVPVSPPAVTDDPGGSPPASGALK